MSVFETPFAMELAAVGIDCLYCPSEEAEKKMRCLADRYLKAYEIKEKHGLLTDYEKQILPGLRLASVYMSSEDADEMWDEIHGRPGCLQPAYWQESKGLLQAK